MATDKKSFSIDVEIDKADDKDSIVRPSVKVSFKDAYKRDNQFTQQVDKVSSASVSQAISKALKHFGDSGVAFVDLGDGPKNQEQEPDGFQGDVPESEKPKKDDGKDDKKSDKKDGDKASKSDDTKPVAPAPAPAAPAKPDAGDKPAPAAPKK